MKLPHIRDCVDPMMELNGPEHANWLEGRTVGIPAGTILVRHTYPSGSGNRQGQPIKRAQEVKVHWATYNLHADTITVNWAGGGGYWKSVDLPREGIVVL